MKFQNRIFGQYSFFTIQTANTAFIQEVSLQMPMVVKGYITLQYIYSPLKKYLHISNTPTL